MNAALADEFVPDVRHPAGVDDPLFGVVRRGSVHGMWAVRGPGIGLAQLTGGSRVVTSGGDGTLSRSGGRLRRRAQDRHVDLAGQRYTLHQTSPRRAQLRRDGVPICWLRSVRIASRARFGRSLPSYRIVAWAEPADPTAAAIAHLLASRYGVGALAALPIYAAAPGPSRSVTSSR
ncbi:MAG TPA: hypothetical protein VHX15_00385 [Frankiaceae bacterium]|jgi:hypothetical protein|nr:hypothetical protein [Frankiaceae bacterium]